MADEQKGKCKRRIVRFAKAGARFLGPMLGPVIPQAVAAIETLKEALAKKGIDGHAKRRMVFETVEDKARELGHAAFDTIKQGLTSEAQAYVRAALEAALFNLRQGHALAELQDWAADDALQDAEDD